MRRLAAEKLAPEKPGHTLQATALVHEVCIRLVNVENAQHWNSRGHFFAAAAEAMRRILVDQARRKRNARRKQARNLRMFFEEQGEHKPTHIIRDRDGKFTGQFCSIIESDGIEFGGIPPLSPNLNPFSERWVQSVKRECLDHFPVLGKKHLHYFIHEYLAYYHGPHQGLGNVPLSMIAADPESVERVFVADLVWHERLGCLLKHYERNAA